MGYNNKPFNEKVSKISLLEKGLSQNDEKSLNKNNFCKSYKTAF